MNFNTKYLVQEKFARTIISKDGDDDSDNSEVNGNKTKQSNQKTVLNNKCKNNEEK